MNIDNIKILRELSECLYNISGKSLVNDTNTEHALGYEKCNKLSIMAQEKMWTLLIHELNKNNLDNVLPKLEVIK